jgi:MFS family permease
MLKTLRQRDFALFWLGGLISVAGDWALIIGLPIYVYVLTGSVLATSVTLISGVAPMILLSSLAGVFVDRWNRQRTLVVVNILLALGLTPLLLVRSADDVWIVAVVVFVETCLEQFVAPAQGALVPALVGEERLVQANSLTALSNNLARLGGPPLGGLIAAQFGLIGIVAADGVSFLVAALCIAGMRLSSKSATRAVAREEARRGGRLDSVMRVWREWAEGLQLISAQQILRVLVVTLAFAALGEGFFGALYPVFVYQELHGGPVEIGALMSAQAVGALIASLLVGWLGARAQSRWVAGLGWIGFGVISLAICYAPTLFPGAWTMLTGLDLPIPIFWVELGLFLAVGIPGLIGSTGTISLLQAQSPDAYRGRVFGAQGALSGIMILVGAALAGTLPGWLSVVTVLSGQGWAKIVRGLIMIAFLPAIGDAVHKSPAVHIDRSDTLEALGQESPDLRTEETAGSRFLS